MDEPGSRHWQLSRRAFLASGLAAGAGANADTAFRIALAGHRLTVTHTDGFPVVPVEVDALLLGMAERYDLTAEFSGDSAPKQSVRIAILADNPGYWPLHCHNTYHAEAGMMSTFDYLN